MGSIFSFLARIDAAIQRFFNTACFRLMRRGWSKSRIRTAADRSCAVAAALLPLAIMQAYGLRAWPVTVFMWAFLGAGLYFLRPRLHDERDDLHILRSADDGTATVEKILWLLVWAVLFKRFAFGSDRHALIAIGGSLLSLCCLIRPYLRSVPAEPPASPI